MAHQTLTRPVTGVPVVEMEKLSIAQRLALACALATIERLEKGRLPCNRAGTHVRRHFGPVQKGYRTRGAGPHFCCTYTVPGDVPLVCTLAHPATAAQCLGEPRIWSPWPSNQWTTTLTA
jgi:hypothetical protein